MICETGFTLLRLIPRLCLPWSQVRDWDQDSKFWNFEIRLWWDFFLLFRDQDWTLHIFETETETDTLMSLIIETFRDRDFSSMTIRHQIQNLDRTITFTVVLQLTNTILFGDTMDQITWVRNGVMIKWNKSNINHQPRFELEFSCHKPDPKSRKFPSRFGFS